MKKTTQEYEVEESCATCAYGTVLQNTGVAVCGKKNEVVRAAGKCRKYEKDLLRLRPQLPRLPEDPD